ncbi:preprotein translocase subunit SecA [Fidelibacter multiformis]|uniref:preprotein translocase subunit SecA n=1 Tax=Fidelibacter multiformis TaxID=3377529 RepID=UPI0037DD9BD5
MIFDLIKKIFGTSSERYIKRITPYISQINATFEELDSASDDDLRNRTREMIDYIESKRQEAREKAESQGFDGERTDNFIYEAEQTALNDLMVEAFAMVKQACKRLLGKEFRVVGQTMVWDMVPFDVQLLGAIVLHQGAISEMKTGEGKTLVATMPVFLNALTGRGVHVVTVNDYLAERDAEWMGIIYQFLGLSVGKILNTMSPDVRKEEYAKDIVYGTNNEFGFDYLRDNMAVSMENVVQRGHYYAIVDEVDSVLIDEARTPLIISGPVQSNTHESYKNLRGSIERLVRAQERYVNGLLGDLRRAGDTMDDMKRGTLLLQCHHGLPKHPGLLKLLEEPGMKKLMHDTESYYMQEKKLHEVDEDLYYSIDEKSHVIDITEKGRQLLAPNDPEQFIIPDIGDEFAKIDQRDDLSDTEKQEEKDRIQRLHSRRSETIHNLHQLLRAYSLYSRDVDYVVKDGKVLIVDEFTGRILPGRRYSDGLHQAIEAKEKVRIEGENQTLATITLQNYFRMYDKLAGMTGTAETEAAEFGEIYKLEVVSIPTNRPVIRKDRNDVIYRTKREKYRAIIEEIIQSHKKGQPVLVGTISVEVSEMLSKMLQRAGIPHNVLNAKQHQREAEIVARAGHFGSVTIATNMAGRGTDIKINEETRNLGGLKIIGTERHESRRIDLQLKGRSGRQGDPGESVFYLSLEDDLMRLFGSDRVSAIMDRLGVEEGEVISHPMISRSIERAQKKVEERNFAIRKHLLEYDDVMNMQREVIYDRRNYALHGGNLREEILAMLEKYIRETVDKFTGEEDIHDWDWEGLRQETINVLMSDIHPDELTREGKEKIEREDVIRQIHSKALATYERKQEIIPPDIMGKLERWAYLMTVDNVWKEHLFELDQLKEGIGLQAYGQKDPLIAYKTEAFKMFEEMLSRIDRESLRLIFRTEVRMEQEPRPEQPRPANMVMKHEETDNLGYQKAAGHPKADPSKAGKTQPIRRTERKIGRNEPCPCGSGKKYKHCCGAN